MHGPAEKKKNDHVKVLGKFSDQIDTVFGESMVLVSGRKKGILLASGKTIEKKGP